MADDDKRRRDAWLIQVRGALANVKATQLCGCCGLRPANCANSATTTTTTAEEGPDGQESATDR